MPPAKRRLGQMPSTTTTPRGWPARASAWTITSPRSLPSRTGAPGLARRAAQDSRLTACEYGLADKNETARMALQYLGSTVFEQGVIPAQSQWADVQIRDVHDVWRELGLDTVDLMKINIEGAEFPLLERMQATGLLPRVDTYLIQFHEWHPGAYQRRRRLHRALRATHRLAWDYHFVWEKWVRK